VKGDLKNILKPLPASPKGEEKKRIPPPLGGVRGGLKRILKIPPNLP